MQIMAEYDYFTKTNFSEYKGKWIALFKDKVVVSGDSFKEVAELVDKHREFSKALITRIPEEMAQLL